MTEAPDQIDIEEHRGLTTEQILDRFTYHRPSELGIERHRILADAAAEFTSAIDRMCPPSREKSMALTHVQEAKMCASAAVALNPTTR